MKYRLPQGRNLLDQLDLKGGGPCTETRPEAVEKSVVGDGSSEAVIENHRHQLPDHLHEAYALVIPSPFWDQEHHMLGRPLHKYSVSEI